jgi:hypothetical protein
MILVKANGRVEVSPTQNRLGNLKDAVRADEAVTKSQLDNAAGGDGYVDFGQNVSAETPTVGVAQSASNTLSFYTAGNARVSVDAQGDINISGGRGVNSTTDTDMWADFTPTDAQNDIGAGTGGAIAVTNYLTTINTDAGGDAFTLGSGTTVGQLKKVRLVTDGGGDATISLAGYTSIVMNDANDFVILKWAADSKWYVIENSGCTINV